MRQGQQDPKKNEGTLIIRISVNEVEVYEEEPEYSESLFEWP